MTEAVLAGRLSKLSLIGTGLAMVDFRVGADVIGWVVLVLSVLAGGAAFYVSERRWHMPQHINEGEWESGPDDQNMYDPPIVTYEGKTILLDSKRMVVDQEYPVLYRNAPAVAIKRADGAVDFYRSVASDGNSYRVS